MEMAEPSFRIFRTAGDRGLPVPGVAASPRPAPARGQGRKAGPGRTMVRIDVGTAVCVASQWLDGDNAGRGHWLRILGVDEYMLDDLFMAESMNLTDVRQHIVWGGPAA